MASFLVFQAIEVGQFFDFASAVQLARSDVDSAFAEGGGCDHVIEGVFKCGGQVGWEGSVTTSLFKCGGQVR